MRPTHPLSSLYWTTLCPTVHPPSSFKAANNNNNWRGEKMNEDEWMCPFHSPPLCPHTPSTSPAPLYPSFLPSLTDCLPACPSPLPPSAYPWFCSPVLWLWPVCITHISVSAAPPSGRPYKGLSFPKVRSEPCTQVLSRHLVWKNKNGLLARPCPVSVCLQCV